MAKNPQDLAVPTVLQSLPLHWSETDEATALRGTANGVDFSLDAGDEKRKELLAQFLGGDVVELSIRFVAFRQLKNKPNAKHVRFTERALGELETTFPGAVMLRDHATWSTAYRAGTVTEAKLKRVRGGHELRLEARITARWAVQQVLEGNFDRFSISWKWPERRFISCSVCGCEIRTNNCHHYPGESLLIDGKRKVVEWIFDQGVARECSSVNTPAVDDTGIERVRHECALFDEPSAPAPDSATPLPEDNDMSKLSEIAKELGLPEDADAATVLAAVKVHKGSGDELSQLRAQNKTLAEGRIDDLISQFSDRFPIKRDAQGNKVQSDEERDMRQLAAAEMKAYGKLESTRRRLDAMSPAVELADAPPVHTPERQSDGPAALTKPGYTGNPAVDAELAKQYEQLGLSDEKIAAANPLNGTKVPKAARLHYYDR